jgi:glutamate racemase
MASPQPIVVFDSSLGGLTVVKALQKNLPNESIIYFGMHPLSTVNPCFRKSSG